MSVPILRRDELLDFTRIATILKETNSQDELKILDELKQQCEKNKISKRDFDSLVKRIKTDIVKPVAVVNNECLPKCITNTGDDYTINDNGIYLLTGKFVNEVCPHPIFPIEVLKDIETGEEKNTYCF